MKILMITEFFSPVQGGLERHVEGLSAALAARKHEVRVLTLGWKGLAPRESKDGYEVVRISGLFQYMGSLYASRQRRFHPPLADPLITSQIAKTIEAFKPDVIHCHGWITYSAVQAKRKFRDVRLVVTLHDYGFICPTRIMLKDGAVCRIPFSPGCPACGQAVMGFAKGRAAAWAVGHNRHALNSVDKFIAVSNFVKDEYEKYLNVSGERICVIPNFYYPDLEEGRAAESIHFPGDFILFVGTLSPSKGVDVLIEAFRQTKGSKLVLIGISYSDPIYESSERIIILQNQPHQVVMDAWNRCRFGVVPSVWPEPFGIVALEAMACGKAVVASDIGGLRDIVVPGETGLLIPPGNAGELARAIVDLLANPAKAATMGENGKKRFLDYFTVDRVVKDLEGCYHG